jgi:ubiquinone/menaquinone biosynthesis C-methylase UbiE
MTTRDNDDGHISDRVYGENYETIFSSGAVGFVARLTHKSLELGFSPNHHFEVTLELGSGHGQHFPYVRHTYGKYFESDIRLENLPQRSQQLRVIQAEINAENLSLFPDGSVNRVVASCVMIHLIDPERALKEIKRVMAPGGIVSLYLSPEPGLLLRSARFFSTGRKFRRLGINHKYFHYKEHRYSFLYLKSLIKTIFPESRVAFKSFPIPFMSWNFSLWNVATIRFPQPNKQEASK